MEITKDKNFIVVETPLYKAAFSRHRGYSLISLSFNGKDTGLYREGCEYWNKIDHFQQENGNGTVRVGKNGMVVTSDLVSPITKKVGGKCKVKWTFGDTLVSKSLITPIEEFDHEDRYICFNPKTYSIFAFDGDGWIDVEHPDETGWWKTVRTSRFINVEGLYLMGNDHLPICAFYNNPLMQEIKVSSLAGEPEENTIEIGA